MKLSEAIRKGRKFGLPQGRGALFSVIDGQICACAMGQALLGAGLVSLTQAKVTVELPEGEYRLSKLALLCNLCIASWGYTAFTFVAGLNDAYLLNLDKVASKLSKQGL
jgi:hypothetical protein